MSVSSRLVGIAGSWEGFGPFMAKMMRNPEGSCQLTKWDSLSSLPHSYSSAGTDTAPSRFHLLLWLSASNPHYFYWMCKNCQREAAIWRPTEHTEKGKTSLYCLFCSAKTQNPKIYLREPVSPHNCDATTGKWLTFFSWKITQNLFIFKVLANNIQ